MPDTVKVVGNHHHVRFLKPYPELAFKQAMAYRVGGWMFIPSVKNGYWDGYISLIKNHTISTGLYRALKDELERIGDVRFEENIVWGEQAALRASGGFRSDRDSQNECIAAMIDSMPVGGGTILAATSYGKTAMAGLFYSQVEGKHLFVVDQTKLLHQSRNEIAQWAKEPVGIVGDGYFEPQRITVATAQTLQSVAKMSKFLAWIGDENDVATVIVDEIHTQLSKRSFQIVSDLMPKARFGLTATLSLKEREVFLKANAFSGPVIYNYPIERGLREGILAQVKYVQVRFKPAVSAKMLDEDSSLDDWYENVVMHPVKNKVLRQLVSGYIKRDRYIVVLADKHKHLDQIVTNLENKNPMLITGKVKKHFWDDYIERFEKGLNRLIVASRVFNKGVSIKRIDVLMNVSEMPDADTIIQQIGRGLRLHDDKSGVIFVDFGTTTGDYRKSAQERLDAVKAAGIPAQVFDFEKQADEFFETVNPKAEF